MSGPGDRASKIPSSEEPTPSTPAEGQGVSPKSVDVATTLFSGSKEFDHGHLQRFLEHRIGDTRMVRLLMKWVKAGVFEDGELHEVKEGSPQGANISPLLSNIYLHYVLDLWVLSWRKKQARGEVYVVRYADDFVMSFQKEQDAAAMRMALAKRLADFGLELHPDKTRVIEFGRFAREDRARRGLGKPETFEFLGFGHIAGIDRQGKFQLGRPTSRIRTSD
jgi:RNA-directed DNA polymerase